MLDRNTDQFFNWAFFLPLFSSRAYGLHNPSSTWTLEEKKKKKKKKKITTWFPFEIFPFLVRTFFLIYLVRVFKPFYEPRLEKIIFIERQMTWDPDNKFSTRFKIFEKSFRFTHAHDAFQPFAWFLRVQYEFHELSSVAD